MAGWHRWPRPRPGQRQRPRPQRRLLVRLPHIPL